jgi:hypothetical protein
LTPDVQCVLVLFMEALPTAADTPPIDPPEDRTERDLRMLDQLAEVGMRLVRAVEQQAMAQAVPEQVGAQGVGALGRMSGGDLALAFSRLARAVRQTIALKAKLVEDRWALDHRQAADQAQRAAAVKQARKAAQKNRVKRIVEGVIDAEADGDDRENLLIDLDLRLDDEDLFADYDERTFGEIVALICRDLGISPDARLREVETWGIGETGMPPAPFASPDPEQRPDPEHPSDPQYRPDPAYWPDPGQTGGFSPQPRRVETSGSDPP